MRNIFSLVLLLLLLPFTLKAEELKSFDYSSFAQIPILHEGRIKPLDSFARVMLKRISGETYVGKLSAKEWLARVLFAPSDAIKDPIFLISSAELIQTLSLPQRSNGKYSFTELAETFSSHEAAFAALREKDKKTLTAQEQKLVGLYDNVNDFADMVGTFSLLRPFSGINDETRHMLGIDRNTSLTYVSLMKFRKEIEAKEASIISQKKEKYSPDELHIANLSARLTLIDAMDKNNSLVRIIPPLWEESEEWLSPWAVINKGVGSPQSAQLFDDWQMLASAYQQGDASAWQRVSQQLLSEGTQSRVVRSWALTLEVLYNTFNLLHKALLVYALGLGFVIASIVRHSRRLLIASYKLLCVGAILNGLAIAMRMGILMRPPVSTLYESMIFVSFITMLFGLWMERKRKAADGLLISGFVASLLLMAANVFAGEGDTLEVLVAVLNTNFWLATHVVCITIGYGSSLVAGTIAHIYLFKRAIGKTSESELIIIEKRIHAVALIALLFTAVGTMLGGIWADQSWGRFWGWDPKENGALWIVLWLIWLLHGRIAGQIRHIGFAVGMALINIVVALAWVGVNLLSVGLHSYGFTNTAADALLSFCALEAAFIGVTKITIMWRERALSY